MGLSTEAWAGTKTRGEQAREGDRARSSGTRLKVKVIQQGREGQQVKRYRAARRVVSLIATRFRCCFPVCCGAHSCRRSKRRHFATTTPADALCVSRANEERRLKGCRNLSTRSAPRSVDQRQKVQYRTGR